MLSQLYRYALCLILVLAGTSSCLSSMEKEIILHPSLEEDKDYAAAYRAASKKFAVNKNFETRHIITITHLNQPFLNSFAARYKRLFNEAAPILNETSGKLGFFISLYSADTEQNRLDKSSLWNLQFQDRNSISKPEFIKTLRSKPEWHPFFPDVSPWTTEYIVLFANSAQEFSSEAKFIISNADTRIEFPL
jgi:hypothetical protein